MPEMCGKSKLLKEYVWGLLYRYIPHCGRANIEHYNPPPPPPTPRIPHPFTNTQAWKLVAAMPRIEAFLLPVAST